VQKRAARYLVTFYRSPCSAQIRRSTQSTVAGSGPQEYEHEWREHTIREESTVVKRAGQGAERACYRWCFVRRLSTHNQKSHVWLALIGMLFSLCNVIFAFGT